MNAVADWVNKKIIKRSQAGITVHNTDRISRILYRFDSYSKLSLHMLRQGIPPSDIIRSQFPFVDPTPSAPIQAILEFTNYCNLRCTYCNSHLALRPQGFMERQTFDNALKGIATLGIKRVCVIGNGESTLHPEFGNYIGELAQITPYVSVLSNAQWRKPEKVVAAMLAAPLKMLEVSVDGGNKESYEASRVRGKFEQLLHNLALIRSEREKRKVPTMVNIRLMLRPSEQEHLQKLKTFWYQYADTVMVQHVIQRGDVPNKKDQYLSVESVEGSFPRCKLPFTVLNINWNGDVPLCNMSARQVGPPGKIIGNVNMQPLEELWNGSIMRRYREGHSQRDEAKMPICKGCVGS